MGKRHEITKPCRPSASKAHFDNLITLREGNPQAYERLGEGTRQSVERYELEQLALAFEYREGMERILEMRKRLPDVYASFSAEMKRKVEEYAEKKHAYQTVTEA